MEIIKSNVEYLGMCPSDEDEILKHIESCARRCWRSEGRIDYPNRSFERFFLHLRSVGHLAAIEHSNVIVEYEVDDADAWNELYLTFMQSALTQLGYFRMMPNLDDLKIAVAGNLRVWHEFFMRKWWYPLYQDTAEFLNSQYPILFSNLLEYVDNVNTLRPNPMYAGEFLNIDEQREIIGTVKLRIVPDYEQQAEYELYDQYDMPVHTFVAYCDRGISHEIVRHRVLSFCQESTRYVNYAKRGLQLIEFPMPDELRGEYVDLMESLERFYNKLNAAGVKPQFARNVLPHSTKTEIAMSGRKSGWDNFVMLRDSDKAHPDIRSVAQYIGEILGITE